MERRRMQDQGAEAARYSSMSGSGARLSLLPVTDFVSYRVYWRSYTFYECEADMCEEFAALDPFQAA